MLNLSTSLFPLAWSTIDLEGNRCFESCSGRFFLYWSCVQCSYMFTGQKFFMLIGLQTAMELTLIWQNHISVFGGCSCSFSVQFLTHTARVVSHMSFSGFLLFFVQTQWRLLKKWGFFLISYWSELHGFMATAQIQSPFGSVCLPLVLLGVFFGFCGLLLFQGYTSLGVS